MRDLRSVSLMSGGIDSPVATHMILRKGYDVAILNMNSGRFSGGDDSEKILSIASRLEELHPGRVALYRAMHEINLSSFEHSSNPKYTCLLCKRAMLMVADGFCERVGADLIVMGDSLGQVASQTLHNLAAVGHGLMHPVVRPLIGFDKLDIESIAKGIGTFDLSIKDAPSCMAAPRYPITRVEADRLEQEALKAGIRENVEKVLDGIVGIDIGKGRPSFK
ncbi:MAG: tRNA 4-thiouridine(8) synthase ThiI [Candidatus Thermoplasmatota archaeon]|nr:tRNA 4-thiouridine(8) synthase ThiI [Candidatus Thermoplasmatota archaeon]